MKNAQALVAAVENGLAEINELVPGRFPELCESDRIILTSSLERFLENLNESPQKEKQS